MMRLDRFENAAFDRGASRAKEMAWLIMSGIFMTSWLPGNSWRRTLLRVFGAKIGRQVVIKPGLRVKFPWRLTVGDYVWLGEDVWIDNLAEVRIASHTCISQGAYLCTGSHNWNDPTFCLLVKPIIIEEGCWVGARATIAPGTIMECGSVLSMGGLGKGRLVSNQVYIGNPALPEKTRMG